MLHQLNATQICQYHEQTVLQAHVQPHIVDPVWQWIAINHMYNGKLWREEDRARRVNVPPEEIARSKRLIDGYNQARNDAVEALDEQLLQLLQGYPSPDRQARLSSETPGAMIDRLSILALKIHHMHLQTERPDVGQEHRDTCHARWLRLQEQRRDLASCLDQLLHELTLGQAQFKLYRQFKMYNDPRLNPWLYEAGARTRVGAAQHER